MAFAAGTKVRINTEDAGAYNGSEVTVVGIEALNPDVFDLDLINTEAKIGDTHSVVEVEPVPGDFAGLMLAMEEGSQNFHAVVPNTDLVAI